MSNFDLMYMPLQDIIKVKSHTKKIIYQSMCPDA